MVAFRIAFVIVLAALAAAPARADNGSASWTQAAYGSRSSDQQLFDRAFDTRPAGSLEEVVRKLSLAIDMLSRYRVPKEAPHIYRVPKAEMENYVCGSNCNIQAWYRPGDGIFLVDTLHPESDLMHRSILLHELVHYFQDRSGAYGDRSSCERWYQRELDAYNIQNRYLGVIGSPSRVAFTADNCANMESKARVEADHTQTFGQNTLRSAPDRD